MPRSSLTALVTGGCRGIGYHVGKEIIKKLHSATCYLTSRDALNFNGHEILIGMELGTAARFRTKFITLDVRDVGQIGELRRTLMSRHNGIDILVNNAAVYLQPSQDSKQFGAQTKTILETNYWGTRNIVTAFMPHFNPNCRIVNITSNMAHHSAGNSQEEVLLRKNLEDKFSRVSTIHELDGMLKAFQTDVLMGCWRENEWPSCAYSVSKMAINVYTRLLQDQLDKDTSKEDVVVNAVYPATPHSKIDQSNIAVTDLKEGARLIFYMATSKKNTWNTRGKVVWNNSNIVDIADDASLHQYDRSQPLHLKTVLS